VSKIKAQSSLGAFLKEQGIAHLVNEPLRNHCTWKIGGPADFLVKPSSWEQIAPVLQYTSENGIPAIVIGKGSNLLFDDAGFRGVVIKIGRKLSRLTISATTVVAESGISTSRLARAVGLAGLSGVEHIVGIPGTLGGLVFMNGGSQRKTIGKTIVEVKALDRHGNTQIFRNEECGFAYRHSRFQNEYCIITEVTMKLATGQRSTIMMEMLQSLRDRRKKFPLTLPNCGSVFKSDPKLYETFGPPGAIISKLGLKGLSVGEAAISERHANFIVNRGAAKAADILALLQFVREEVTRQTGITLNCEVRIVRSCGIVEFV